MSFEAFHLDACQGGEGFLSGGLGKLNGERACDCLSSGSTFLEGLECP